MKKEKVKRCMICGAMLNARNARTCSMNKTDCYRKLWNSRYVNGKLTQEKRIIIPRDPKKKSYTVERTLPGQFLREKENRLKGI